MTTTTARPASRRGDRAESFVQVVILLAIGGCAAAASFTHVHNVAAAHGQPGWLAWADAVVLELMSIATGLEIRRRHRARQPAGFVLGILAAAVALSLSAQVVEAEPSAIGWLAAALPALGFLACVKIVLTRNPTTPAQDRQDRQDETPAARPARPSAPAFVPPVASKDRQDEPPPVEDEPVPVDLLSAARGPPPNRTSDRDRPPITRDELRAALRVSTDSATDLLRQIRTTAPTDDACRHVGTGAGPSRRVRPRQRQPPDRGRRLAGQEPEPRPRPRLCLATGLLAGGAGGVAGGSDGAPPRVDAVKEVAERNGVCVRPVAIRRVDTATGETSIIEVPCGATLASKCKPCAERGRRLRIQQIREGWHLTEEPAVPVDPPDVDALDLVHHRAQLEFERDTAVRNSDFDQLPELDENIRQVEEAFRQPAYAATSPRRSARRKNARPAPPDAATTSETCPGYRWKRTPWAAPTPAEAANSTNRPRC